MNWLHFDSLELLSLLRSIPLPSHLPLKKYYIKYNEKYRLITFERTFWRVNCNYVVLHLACNRNRLQSKGLKAKANLRIRKNPLKVFSKYMLYKGVSFEGSLQEEFSSRGWGPKMDRGCGKWTISQWQTLRRCIKRRCDTLQTDECPLSRIYSKDQYLWCQL